jgi:hypothetical protein
LTATGKRIELKSPLVIGKKAIEEEKGMRGEHNPFGSAYDFGGAFLRNRCDINISNFFKEMRDEKGNYNSF